MSEAKSFNNYSRHFYFCFKFLLSSRAYLCCIINGWMVFKFRTHYGFIVFVIHGGSGGWFSSMHKNTKYIRKLFFLNQNKSFRFVLIWKKVFHAMTLIRLLIENRYIYGLMWAKIWLDRVFRYGRFHSSPINTEFLEMTVGGLEKGYSGTFLSFRYFKHDTLTERRGIKCASENIWCLKG